MSLAASDSVAVYDVASRESFDHLEKWLSELDLYATNKDVVKMFVANKIDQVEWLDVFMYWSSD